MAKFQPSSSVHFRLSLVALLGIAGCQTAGKRVAGMGPDFGRGSDEPISRAALVEAISKYVCAWWSEEDGAYVAGFGDESCVGESTGPSYISRVAAKAVGESAPLARLSSSAYSAGYALLESRVDDPPSELSGALREIWWSDPLLGRVAMNRAQLILAEDGKLCVDCEPVLVPPVLEMEWSTLARYVLAYIWPVEDPESPGGLAIYTCGDVNGTSSTDGDPVGIRAGFLIAANYLAQSETGAALMRTIEAGRVQHATREEMSERIRDFAHSHAAVASACATLSEFEWFLGVRMSKCAKSESPSP